MGAIRDLAEKLWTGEVTTEERHPFTPLMEIDEVADGVGFLSSFANVTAIKSGEGLTLIDTGGFVMASMVYGMLRHWSKERVELAVYTHGHVDHVCGIEPFDEEAGKKGWKRPHVIAHRALPARFD